jgi:hypothetical protein
MTARRCAVSASRARQRRSLSSSDGPRHGLRGAGGQHEDC